MGRTHTMAWIAEDETDLSNDELLDQISELKSVVTELDQEIARLNELRRSQAGELEELAREAAARFLPDDKQEAIVSVGDWRIFVSRKNGRAEVYISSGLGGVVAPCGARHHAGR